MSFLPKSDRLEYSVPGPEDAADWLSLNSDPEVLRFTGDTAFKDHQSAVEFLQEYRKSLSPGYGRFNLRSKSDQKFIGWCGLKQHTDFTDLGYRIKREHWGKGYATEAASACLKFGFSELGLEEIIGRTAAENVASVRILENLGFTLIGKDECHGIPDALIYKITSWEYRTISNG